MVFQKRKMVIKNNNKKKRSSVSMNGKVNLHRSREQNVKQK